MKKIHTKNNYYENTFGMFTPLPKTPNREPDFVSYNKSFYYFKTFILMEEQSYIDDHFEEFDKWRNSDYKFEVSSRYWYEQDKVIRESYHWGEVGSCFWSCPFPIGEIFFKDFKEIKKFKLNEVNSWGEIDVETPLIESGEYLAYEFGEVELCIINSDTRKSYTPLLAHPNHKSNYVNIIL